MTDICTAIRESIETAIPDAVMFSSVSIRTSMSSVDAFFSYSPVRHGFHASSASWLNQRSIDCLMALAKCSC